MNCQKCGNELVVGETFCRRCGYNNTVDAQNGGFNDQPNGYEQAQSVKTTIFDNKLLPSKLVLLITAGIYFLLIVGSIAAIIIANIFWSKVVDGTKTSWENDVSIWQ